MPILPISTPSIKPGDTYNQWTVLGQPFRVKFSSQGRTFCVAQCSCGVVSVVQADHVRAGRSRNCGCVRRVTLPASSRTHGKTMTQLYRVWKGMRERCENPNHKAYLRYGGRGVKVCQEWDTDYTVFEGWALANGWRPGLQVDRKDNGDYAPESCRIVTSQENSNNRRHNRIVEAWGESKTIWHWSQDSRCQVSHAQLRGRIKQGWDAEEAMTTPQVHERTAPVPAFGEAKTVAEWARDPRCKVAANCLFMRIFEYGWNVEEAITTPARGYRK